MTDRRAALVVGCVLAGGLARRMGGGDKGMIEVGGRPILATVIERLAPQVSLVIVNANGDPARFAAFGLPVVADTAPGYAGPLAGVLAALRWAQVHAPGAIWVAILSVLPVLGLAVRLMRHKIGGFTGDLLGATQQLTEIALLLAIAGASAARGPF